MPPQTHVILREVVEVTLRGSQHARAVHEAAARVMRGTVPGLIQRQCDELSHPETIHRLDAVEIDLGRVPLAEFERAFARALEIAIPARLGEAMRGAGSARGGRRVTRAASHLELIDHFTRTGALPWWTDRARRDTVAESVRFLGREGAPGLAASVRRWAQEDVALRRIVRACVDDDLHGLLMVLRADVAWTFRALLGALHELAEGSSFPHGLRPEAVRLQAWQDALGAAASPLASPARDALLHEIVERIGAAFELPPRALYAALFEQTERGVVRADTELARFLRARRVDDPSASPARVRQSERPLAGLLDAIEPALARGPDNLRAGLDDVLAKFGPDAPWPVDDLQRWLRAALSTGALPRGPLQRWLARFGADRAPSAQPLLMAVRSALAAATPRPADAVTAQEADAPSATGFSDADAFSVDNAGLVILWPFFQAFFTHRGLLVEKRFIDDAAPHRAIALLQFLLTEDRLPPPEYLLPLNKVLCGLRPEILYEPGPPVTDEDQAECERFLAAVIEQAPILRQMSLPGFRGSFLARQGQLSTRDGTWLLRVERETYDVVLERFPWSFGWVRLPWMPAPMTVEW